MVYLYFLNFFFFFFCLISFFCFRIPSRIPHLVIISPLDMTISQNFLVSSQFEEFYSGILQSAPPHHHWKWCDFFSTISPGLIWIWERKTPEAKCHSHYIILRIHAINMIYSLLIQILITWLREHLSATLFFSLFLIEESFISLLFKVWIMEQQHPHHGGLH